MYENEKIVSVLNKLEEKIISDGKVLEGDVLKVDSFLNHRRQTLFESLFLHPQMLEHDIRVRGISFQRRENPYCG